MEMPLLWLRNWPPNWVLELGFLLEPIFWSFKIQNKLGGDKAVVTVFTDSNKKYLSTDLTKEEPVKEGFCYQRILRWKTITVHSKGYAIPAANRKIVWKHCMTDSIVKLPHCPRRV